MPTLLIQLPVPQLNFGRRTGNVPLAGANLRAAWGPYHPGGRQATTLLPQATATYLGDAALLNQIRVLAPDWVGFSAYAWNIDRTLWLASQLKNKFGLKIIIGGPEVTADNPRLGDADIDILVCGEGESLFPEHHRLLAADTPQSVTLGPDKGFCQRPSPYLMGDLTPELDNMVLLETQRGCPHQCGYCFYGKGRRRIHLAEEAHILTAAQWTCDHGIGELYLLDPALNARPGLESLLKRLGAINAHGAMSLHSEIRAEAVDAPLAEAMAEAGFRSLEIGLQSTTPKALELTGRRCDLKRFLMGVRHLMAHEIECSIDLIIGLPGDSLAGFRDSIDFVADNGLAEHLQVFPLSVLPGTRFRQEHQALGLHYDPSPPYLLTRTGTFSAEAIEAALDYAETRCKMALYPRPDLDIAWQQAAHGDVMVSIDGQRYIQKLILTDRMSETELVAKANALTHPYQIVVGQQMRDPARLTAAITILTAANPHTPLDLVLLNPAFEVRVERLLGAARLVRPHYLDKDLQYAFPCPGNRAMMITLVRPRRERTLRGPMCRQVYAWPRGELPTTVEMQAPDLQALDGILLGDGVTPVQVEAWQRRQLRHVDDLPAISFASVAHQRRWRALTSGENYVTRHL